MILLPLSSGGAATQPETMTLLPNGDSGSNGGAGLSTANLSAPQEKRSHPAITDTGKPSRVVLLIDVAVSTQSAAQRHSHKGAGKRAYAPVNIPAAKQRASLNAGAGSGENSGGGGMRVIRCISL